ncbi:TIGR03013 family XrtA/PEP-CTERM system glycosyltransferase [Trichloromonas sp.]|uniref:TIGR03013 family XrtA/PEP-CTERM system glycosyltransferase n=1 Tax=Trichloromonas sp. TaxID=3069249 RepID=UPI002A419FA0|nr:TIGR03013 family PEP-CTERM/XrtA system glycosyltransferase [Trichloromonas sp.]
MRKLTYIILLVDLLLAALALMVGHLLRFEGVCNLGVIAGPGGSRLLIFSLLAVFSAYFCEMYRWEKSLGRLDLAARTAVSILMAFFVLSAVYYIAPQAMVGRGVLSFSLLVFGVMQFFAHLVFLALMELPALARRVLIIGVGPLAATVERVMGEHPGRQVCIGFVKPTTEQCTVDEKRIVGEVEEIVELVERERADLLVVALTERRGGLPVRELLRCKLNGVEIVDALSFYEATTGKLLIENIQPSWFLYSEGFRITTFLRFYKRGFDIFLSLLGILLVLPLWPLVALLVKIDSPGPVFFRQVRVGEKEKDFTVYKFRTMRQDAEKETGAVWATQNDPRVTRLGKFLRKSRIDELPQLYNVLKGDMSFVGPRPERPEFVERLNQKIPYYGKRHCMKPGVTGWAQVCYPYGASDEDALEKLRYDLYYIKNYSIWLDFLIILETVKVVAFGRGGR